LLADSTATTIDIVKGCFFLLRAVFLSFSDPVRLRLRDYVSPGEAYHLGRRSGGASFRGTPHTHDFAEVLWIERGPLAHLVNGERRLLEDGDVVFVRPDDVHTFKPVAGRPFTQVNVAFADETLGALQQRYFRDASWVWTSGALPTTHRLDRVQLARLSELATLLVAGPPSRLLLERFLLELLHDLVEPPPRSALPPWLTDAIRRLAGDPDALARGVLGLASLAGRSREHVNRVIRAQTGQTATSVVNEVRLNQAATQLRMTDRPIVRIANDCGIPNLSHFYRLFNARFGVTPRQYRLGHQTLIHG
jgi:AraC family cel operon transcriptional repressor